MIAVFSSEYDAELKPEQCFESLDLCLLGILAISRLSGISLAVDKVGQRQFSLNLALGHDFENSNQWG